MECGEYAVGLDRVSCTRYPEDGESYVLEIDPSYASDPEQLGIRADTVRSRADEICVQTDGGYGVKADFINSYLYNNISYDQNARRVVNETLAGQPKTSIYTAYGALFEGNAAQSGLVLAASVSGAASLKSLCKVFHKTVVFAMGFATTLMAGLLSLQKIVGASADNIATDAAKFALGSVIPVVGSILTDALGTVLGCIKALRGSVGVVGIFVLLTLMLPVAVRVLLQTQLCRLAGALSELFGESSVTEFLESVAAVWSMLAALTVCQGVYFIAATALMAT